MTDTMTTPERGVRVDSYLRITSEQLFSINSLSHFADKPSGMTPVIEGLLFSRGDNSATTDTLTVVATNRYVCAKAEFEEMAFEDNNGFWHHDDTLWIDQSTLKQAVTMAKAIKTNHAIIGYSVERAAAFITVGDNTLYSSSVVNAYPAIAKLYPESEPNGASSILLNPKWLALISKIVLPETGSYLKDSPWEFQFATDITEGFRDKPKPVVARIGGSKWEIKLLIQPNMAPRT